jgi:hypothetical protein
MKHLILTAILLNVTLILKAQANCINLTTWDQAYYARTEPDGHFLITGKSNSSLLYLETDTNAVIYNTFYYKLEDSDGQFVQKTSDGNLFFLLHDYHLGEPGENFYYALKTDVNGNELWKSQLNNQYLSSNFQFMEEDTLQHTYLFASNDSLFTFTIDGIKLQSVPLNKFIPHYLEGYFLDKKDGFYTLIGKDYYNNPHLYVSKFDANLNLIDSFSNPITINEGFLGFFTREENDNFIFRYDYHHYDRICRLNSNQNIEVLSENIPISINGLFSLGSQGYFAVGVNDITAGCPRFAKFDKNGQILWTKNTGNCGSNYGEIMAAPLINNENNSQFTIIGQRNCGNDFSYDVSILNTDTITGLISDLTFLENNDNSLTIAPNPANEVLKIYFSSIDSDKNNLEILDIHGRLIQTIPIVKEQKEIEISIQNWVNGIYLTKIRGYKPIIFTVLN